MKKLINAILLIIAVNIGGNAIAQEKKATVVKLTQIEGDFEEKSLELEAGKPYIFEVTNDGVDHEVGFVVAPKGKPEQKNHIKNAYTKSTIKEGQTVQSNVVTLEKGDYEYFCPMNPTPHYTITVQ